MVFEVKKELYFYKEDAKANLLSIKGIEMSVNRSSQVEGTFGIIKQDMNYDRFRRRGLENVEMEFMLVALGHTITKLFTIIDAKAKLDYWVAPKDLKPEVLSRLRLINGRSRNATKEKIKSREDHIKRGAKNFLVS